MRYADGLALQEQLVKQRQAGEIEDTLLLLEHDPVFTLGRNARAAKALERVGLDPARTELRLESGPAASTLLDLAAAGGFDLVAAGRRGLSAWRDLLTGGVSEKLLLLSPCPILLAHA